MMIKWFLFLMVWFSLAVPAAAYEAELFTAVKAGDAAGVEALLEAGADVGIKEAYFKEERSPLYYALEANDLEIARLLIEAGALEHFYWDVPDAMGVFYRTALGRNLIHNRYDIVDFLLECGAAEIDKQRREYMKAFTQQLEYAVFNNNLKRLESVLAHTPSNWEPTLSVMVGYQGADPNIRASIENHFPKIADGSVTTLELLLDPDSDKMGAGANTVLPLPSFPMASSSLDDPRFPARYTVDKAFDDDRGTAWVEGDDGPGIGERIAFELPPDVQGIEIFAGYGEERYYLPNNRVKKADLTVYLMRLDIWQFDHHGYHVEEVDSMEMHFEDTPQFQSFPLNTPAIQKDGYVLFAVLEIREVYPGTKWDDTCIAEIKLIGGPDAEPQYGAGSTENKGVVLELKLGTPENKPGEALVPRLTDDSRMAYSIISYTARDGKIYIVESIHYRVLVYDYEGNFLHAVSYPRSLGIDTTVNVRGIAVDDDFIYLLSQDDNRVLVVDAETGDMVNLISEGGSQSGRFLDIAHLTIDHEGYLHIHDRRRNGKGEVYTYRREGPRSRDGQMLKWIVTEQYSRPGQMVPAPDYTVYFAKVIDDSYKVTSHEGDHLIRNRTRMGLASAEVVGTDTDGNVYVMCEEYGGQIAGPFNLKVITPKGREVYSLTTSFWGGGGPIMRRVVVTTDGEVFDAFFDGNAYHDFTEEGLVVTKLIVKRIK